MNWFKSRLLNLKERIWGDRLSRWEIVFFVLTAAIFLINATYVAYPDEFVNLLGGAAINQGKLPYRDFFDHHLPFAWYYSAVLLKLSFNNFVLFRLLYAASAFGILYWLAMWIRRNYREFYNYFLGFFIVYPMMAVYFWFHLFLADGLAVLFFSVAFWILIIQTLSKKVSFKATVFASLATFSMVFSSLTFLYMAGALYLWQIYLIGIKTRNFFYLLFWMGAPYLVYLIYLLLTGTFADFYFSNFTYNTNLYISIPNYTKGRFFNPVKFALTLIHNFWDGYLPLLSKIKHLDLYLPVGTLAGLGTLLLLGILSLNGWFLGLLYFIVLSFSAPRSNIQSYKETDYQSSMFLVLGLASSMIVFYLLKKFKHKNEVLNDVRRVGQFLLAVFFAFTFIFLAANTYKKAFQRYTQQFPGITNYSHDANFISGIINSGDYYWVGPYEPNQAFFVRNGKLPGKYPTLLPQFRENDYLKSSFIEQFEKNPPKIIIYKHTASIFQTPAMEFGAFFVDWMKPRYASLEEMKIKALKTPSEYNIESDLYIRNSQKEEVLGKLRSQGYIE